MRDDCIEYSDLVDAAQLQALLDSLNQVTGIANAVLGIDGRIIAQSGWQAICTKFHRANPEACQRCLVSDTRLAEQMTGGREYAVYNCMNGLVDTASPIVIEGRHVANIFAGQLFTQAPDPEFFRQQARLFGFDETEYLAAVAQVPIVPAEKVEAQSRFYVQLAVTLAENGMDRLRQRKASDELRRLNAELESRILERTQALAESEERLRLALGSARQGWFDLNVRTEAVSVSPEYVNLIGYDSSVFQTSIRNWLDNVHPDDRSQVLAAYQSALTSGAIPNLVYRRKSGSAGWIWIETVGEVVEWDQDGKPLRIIGIHKDVTERKMMEEEVQRLAYIDPLTNLPNRRLLLDRLVLALSHAKRYQHSLAIMFLDLDNFKLVNDTLGHDVGDGLLKEIALRLAVCMRAGDTVSRPGGDEFIIVLSKIAHPEDAALVAEKIIKEVNAPVRVDDHALMASTSIGIAVYPIDGNDDAQELMIKADKAMYCAKQAGGNAYRFSSE